MMKLPLPHTLRSRLIASHLLVGLLGIALISVFAGLLILDATGSQFVQLYRVLRQDIPMEDALASAWQFLRYLLLISLAVALVVCALGYWLAARLSRSLRGLVQTAERLSQGDFSAQVQIPNAPQELNHIAKTLNTLTARLQSNADELGFFVANAGHELRTPLTSVKLRVEALRSGALEDTAVAERFLAEIESEVDRLSRMVDDLLDLSRIEAGLASQERTSIDLAAIVGEVSEILRVRAERTGIAINLNVEPGLLRIQGNEDQLRRMVYNLVDNAVKYSMRGGEVNLNLQNVENDDCVQMVVQDRGYGIAPKHLPHIFERFYRVEATRPRHGPPQGSGLGLPIAKSIIEIHGGKIAVTSQIGVGTTFLVELPAKGSSDRN